MCLEVLPFAILMFIAYPAKLVDDDKDGMKLPGGRTISLSDLERNDKSKFPNDDAEKAKNLKTVRTSSSFFDSVRHALAVNDVLDDTRTYTDYQYGDFTSLGRQGDELETVPSPAMEDSSMENNKKTENGKSEESSMYHASFIADFKSQSDLVPNR